MIYGLFNKLLIKDRLLHKYKMKIKDKTFKISKLIK